MELRKDELKKIAECRNSECKCRFQIVKLEERISPHHRSGHYSQNPHEGPSRYGPGRSNR
jgi:hypothetical protein